MYDGRLAAAGANPFRADEVYVHPCRHSSDQAVKLIFSQVIHDPSKPDGFLGEIGGVEVHGASGNREYFKQMTFAVFGALEDQDSPSIGDIPGEVVNDLVFVAGAGFWHSMRRPNDLPVNFQQYNQFVRDMKTEMTEVQLEHDMLFKAIWNLWILHRTFRITCMNTQDVLANHVGFLPRNKIDGIELSWTLGKLIFGVGEGVSNPALA